MTTMFEEAPPLAKDCDGATLHASDEVERVDGEQKGRRGIVREADSPPLIAWSDGQWPPLSALHGHLLRKVG